MACFCFGRKLPFEEDDNRAVVQVQHPQAMAATMPVRANVYQQPVQVLQPVAAYGAPQMMMGTFKQDEAEGIEVPTNEAAATDEEEEEAPVAIQAGSQKDISEDPSYLGDVENDGAALGGNEDEDEDNLATEENIEDIAEEKDEGQEAEAQEEMEEEKQEVPEVVQEVEQESAEVAETEGAEVVPEEGAEVVPEEGAEVVPEEGAEVVPEEEAEVVPEEGAEVVPEEGAEVVPEEGAEVVPEEEVIEDEQKDEVRVYNESDDTDENASERQSELDAVDDSFFGNMAEKVELPNFPLQSFIPEKYYFYGPMQDSSTIPEFPGAFDATSYSYVPSTSKVQHPIRTSTISLLKTPSVKVVRVREEAPVGPKGGDEGELTSNLPKFPDPEPVNSSVYDKAAVAAGIRYPFLNNYQSFYQSPSYIDMEEGTESFEAQAAVQHGQVLDASVEEEEEEETESLDVRQEIQQGVTYPVGVLPSYGPPPRDVGAAVYKQSPVYPFAAATAFLDWRQPSNVPPPQAKSSGNPPFSQYTASASQGIPPPGQSMSYSAALQYDTLQQPGYYMQPMYPFKSSVAAAATPTEVPKTSPVSSMRTVVSGGNLAEGEGILTLQSDGSYAIHDSLLQYLEYAKQTGYKGAALKVKPNDPLSVTHALAAAKHLAQRQVAVAVM